jgi:hypothetical protein
MLEFVSTELRDHEIVLEAVRQNWKAIAYAPPEFLEDLEISMAASHCFQ